ncbi:MAG: hypothetical protein H7A44_07890 [Opitutaceae bacterium]|nr:hypothetical protein [Opitutaceae bacterium]
MLKTSIFRVFAGASVGAAVIFGLFWLGVKNPKVGEAVVTIAGVSIWLFGWISFFRSGTITFNFDTIEKSKRPKEYWGWFIFYTLTGLLVIGLWTASLLSA